MYVGVRVYVYVYVYMHVRKRKGHVFEGAYIGTSAIHVYMTTMLFLHHIVEKTNMSISRHPFTCMYACICALSYTCTHAHENK
jgi:hypothetical protein